MEPEDISKIFEIIKPEEVSSRIQTGKTVVDIFKRGCPPCDRIFREFGPVKEFADSNNIELLAINYDYLLIYLRDIKPSRGPFPFFEGIPVLLSYSDGKLINKLVDSRWVQSGYIHPTSFIDRLNLGYNL